MFGPTAARGRHRATSRTITSQAEVDAAVAASGWTDRIAEVVSGHADGADLLGEAWATARGIQVKLFPVFKADWDRQGPAAGSIRNGQMVAYLAASPRFACIALPRGKASGTTDMIRQCRAAGVPVYVADTQDDGLLPLFGGAQ